MNIPQLIENTLYFLALINPTSKILFLSTKEPPYDRRGIYSASFRSSLVAWLILISFIASGNFVLVNIFHVDMYSLSVAGGIILFIIGLNAVRKGQFYEKEELHVTSDFSIIPLAAPLIAGPGVMTAALSFASMHGVILTLICITIAILINFLLMLMSLHIGKFLKRINAINPITRITGLIVSAVAMQMIFSGCAMWISKAL